MWLERQSLKEPVYDILSNLKYPNFKYEEYFHENDIHFKTHESDGHTEYAICCPECVNNGEPTPDKRYKLWVNSKQGLFYCYRCSFSGFLPRLIQKISNVGFTHALKILRGQLIDPLDFLNLRLCEEKREKFSLTPKYEDVTDDTLKEVELPHGYQLIDGPNDYLIQRGIPWKYAFYNDWGIANAGFCKDRIIVPFYMADKLVFWQARATIEEEKNKEFKKVLNPSGVSSKSILYNFDIAKTHEDIVLVEGFVDAVKVGVNAMATNGKHLHPEQVEWLQKTKAKRITIMWDADSWHDHLTSNGKRRIKKGKPMLPSIIEAARLLKMYRFEVKLVQLPEGIDPGDFKYRSPRLQKYIQLAKQY